MFGLGPFEMMVIGVVAVVLFGANLPEVARQAGGMYREFRGRLNEVQREFRAAEYEATKAFNMDSNTNSSTDEDDDEPSEPSAPKFTPPS
ncbi:Sec-independent protein translocase subunit TatA/TatB [Roseiconus lacunae]|uniref:Twin-arginine translocase TatA/TatE family subunit n=1 Tax=Roseiconus lacunae TaxID=2605694 RepID=A0ABT7PS78_9BACT|nr:twin-arginine translocase TatA/TatE family subunit [Roseiconus lacunae]MCD0459240.1 twin-arginine translocase TatA/TatE family subunit [Roseiconus lacunae]MDM4019350.1 twin-arginine translocase TatA/TatE family subunit [Roseiconus lacunae]WRQ53667.1 twin-arginine translocase TatA/TatE family subunit [Stieleria sp. HD01]